VIDQSPHARSRSDGQTAHPDALRPHLLDRRHNLPSEFTSLVGRTEAINELRRLLISTRLLTLTGPGGIGKTRLALALGRTVLPDHPDGVWLVELASLAAPALVAPTTAAVLGIYESGGPVLEHLVDVLRPSTMLLVLDNCEHLSRACAELAEHLLRACPDLQILATSREPLDVRGEVVWRVPGLSVPAPGSVVSALQQLATVDAIQLFAQRARASSGLRLTAQNSAAVASICRQLDGIPLAIELAAGRTNVLTPQEIAGKVGHLVGVLNGGSHSAPARQQTMRATLDWSYGLLSDGERRLFTHLSVFAGGWTLDSAVAICADSEPMGPVRSEDILDITGRLVDQSLVVAEPSESGGMRYRMLEPIRQYAFERLRGSARAATIRTHHRDWYLTLAEATRPALFGPHQRTYLVRLEREHDNLRAALEWSLQNASEPIPALRLAGALYWFWRRCGHGPEGRAWLARALALDVRLGTRAEPAAQRARLQALKGAGILACEQGDYRTAQELVESSLELAEELDDVASTADALYWKAFIGFFLGQREHGRELMQRSLALWRQVGNPWGMTWPLGAQSRAAAWRGDYARALALAQERLRLAREADDPWLIALVLSELGVFAYHQGQHDLADEFLEASQKTFIELHDPGYLACNFTSRGVAARRRGDRSVALECFGESLRGHHRLGQVWGVADGLEGMASVLSDLGRSDSAAELIGSATALRDRHGLQVLSDPAADNDEVANTVRTALGAARFDAIRAKGELLDANEAITHALALVSSMNVKYATGSSTQEHDDDSLTPREREVATLVADGLSNREIAERLVIAVSTAERHVANILAKLAITSRTQLATWMLQHGAQKRGQTADYVAGTSP
jgi:predicted ATPase/DNA-binding CsgD family transcriptional regulator